MINNAKYRLILNLLSTYSYLTWGNGHGFLAAFGVCEAPFYPEPRGSAAGDDYWDKRVARP